MRLRLKQSLFLSLLCMSYFCSYGTDLPIVVLNQTEEIIGLDTSISLAIAEGNEVFDTINLRPNISQSEFRPIKYWEGKIEKDKTYWGAFQLENRVLDSGSHEVWIMEFSAMNSHLDVYVLTEDHQLLHSKAGAFIPLKEHTFIPKAGSNVVSVNIPRGQKVTIYFKTKCERKNHAPEFTIALSELSYFMKSIRFQVIIDGVYLGVALMLMIYNLMLNVKIKKRSYLFYSAYILGIVVYIGYKSGFLAYAFSFTSLANFLPAIQFFKFSIYIALVCYLYFSRIFLRLSKHMPWWDTIFKWLTYAALPCIAFEYYYIIRDNYSYSSDIFNTIYALVFVSFSCWFAVELLLRRKEILGAKYIARGTICMSIGIIITAYLRYQELTFSLWPFQFFSIFEFSFFSLGLANVRMKNEKEKQEKAIELEKNKLKLDHQTKQVLNQLELIKTQRKFYDYLTHEYKTPITIIKNLVSFGDLNEVERKMIEKNADNLLKLVQEQLEISKSKSTQLKVNWDQIELVNTLKNWINSFKPNDRGKGQRIFVYNSSPAIYLNTDSTHLEKIINNLVVNALKFTPKEGRVFVTVNDDKEQVRIEIEDTGIGISEKDLPFIFNKAYQVDSPYKKEGSGIGLSLVKELTQLIGGKIKVDSELAKGSTFTLILPRYPTLEKYETNLQKEISPMEVSGKVIEEDMIIETLPSTLVEQDTILIIEDNEDIVYIYKKILSDKFHLAVAIDGEEGYEKAVELVPDIIICDVMMPVMDGFIVCEKLRSNKATNHIPIIMVTAKTNPRDKRHGMRNGVDHYLTKPFNKEELVIIIENLQARNKALLERFKASDFNDPIVEVDIFKIENEFLQGLIRVIEQNLLTENFLAQDIADELGISMRSLRKKLKTITDFTIPQFITNYRVYKAKRLLKETDDRVQSIGYEVGFNAPEVFTREFKKIVKQTPTEYRNNP